MKESEGFVSSSELDEAESKGGNDGTGGKSSANAFWSLYQVQESEY